jgi:hypothetical protein
VELFIANPIFYVTDVSRIHMEILCLLHVCLCFRSDCSYDNMRHSDILTLQQFRMTTLLSSIVHFHKEIFILGFIAVYGE